MKHVRAHLPILVSLVAIVYGAYGRLLSTPLSNPLDFQILIEAAPTSRNPLPMFMHLGTYLSQPILRLLFALEHSLFCTRAAGYQAVNLGIHALNAFLVYMLVNMLFNRRGLAILAATLFALSVGSYGKILMSVANQEGLLLAHLYLLVLYLLIRNDWRHQGRLGSPFFVGGLALFLVAGLTKPTTFALLGCLLAYKFFFYRNLGWRAVLSRNYLVLLAIGLVFWLAQTRWGYHPPQILRQTDDPLVFGWISIKNVFRYLTLMIFPLQPSPLIAGAPGIVQVLFEVRTVIRFVLTIAILSFSFFGFVFGNRPLRFFIAWTYITVLPFTGLAPSGEWLNLAHLYLTSIGFCIILAAGAAGAAGLLRVRRWRRLLPYSVLLGYVVISLSVTYQLDRQNRARAEREVIRELHEAAAATCD